MLTLQKVGLLTNLGRGCWIQKSTLPFLWAFRSRWNPRRRPRWPSRLHRVPKNVHLFIFCIKLRQKLTNLNDFSMLNSEKIWHECLTDLSTSPIRCSHLTLGNPKKSFSTVLFIHTYIHTYIYVHVLITTLNNAGASNMHGLENAGWENDTPASIYVHVGLCMQVAVA